MTDKFWELLLERIGCLELSEDPRFNNMRARAEHRDALTETLDAIFKSKETRYWFELLQTYIPVAPVHDLPKALDNPFVTSIGMKQSMEHHAIGTYQGLSNPIKFDNQRLTTRCGSGLGSDNEAILGEELGLEDLESLKDSGII